MITHAQRKFKQTQSVEEATGMRNCAHGQHEVDAEKGSFVMRGKIKSWMCFGCQVKTGRRKA